jgi:hypothetical protein
MMPFRNMREQVTKPLRVAVRQEGAHFRVVYWHEYPHAVEEVVYTERFKTQEDAQRFCDTGLRAQRIYRNLMRMNEANHRLKHDDPRQHA